MGSASDVNGSSGTTDVAVPLEQYLRSVITGQEQKTEQRFASIEGRMMESASQVKDALTTANSLIVTAAIAVDKRFDAAMAATEKATLKAEGVTASQIESVQAEMRIRLGALDAKLDTAVSQLQHTKGRDSGMAAVWGGGAVMLTLVLSAAGIIVAIVTRG